MMVTRGLFVLGMLSGVAQQCTAQSEVVSPLHAVPRWDQRAPMVKSAGLHQTFLYDYLTQTELPIVDDFSVDRTRHRTAQEEDANVALTQTIYRLEVNGISTPDMMYMTDTTFHYTVDLTQADTTIITITANPDLLATVRVVTQYPVTEQTGVHLWPPYTVIDTVGGVSQHQIPLDPDLLQDSMLVYTVDAITDLYRNANLSTSPLILWADDDAYVNGTFPLEPPTIGVATLDGMDRTGYPYMPLAPNTEGLADHLTTVPIDLQSSAADSVYLSFFYEPVGLSGDNANIHAEDSLRLEFYAPATDTWTLRWSVPGDVPIVFKQALIPIKESEYLTNNFRFRFSNKATLGGAVDQWHVDYVRLGRNRSYADTVLKDVAYTYPETSLLQTFTSVPFSKFTQAPSAYMAQQVDLQQKNLDIQSKFITWGYGVNTDCGSSESRDGYGNNIADNASSTFNTTHPVNSGADPLVYDLSGCTDAAFANVKFWTNSGAPDACAYNDTVAFTQEISNYYSYDDGSAEAGYSIANGTGSKIAYRFATEGGDSLRALRMYFDPIFTYNPPPVNHPEQGSFLITVWSSLDPENIIFQNVSFSKPEYNLWGPNHFVEYPLDSTIAVENTFYVGWVQTNSMEMNLGLDKNRDNHDKMFYKTGNSWANSSYEASWMIRPVMVAAVDPFAGVDETPEQHQGMVLYPDPASDHFSLMMAVPAVVSTVELLDATGRAVRQWRYADAMGMSVQDVAPGLYVVRASGRDGHPLAQSRLMVQH